MWVAYKLRCLGWRISRYQKIKIVKSSSQRLISCCALRQHMTYDLIYASMVVQVYLFELLIDLAHNYLVLMVVMMVQLWVFFLQRLGLSYTQSLSHMHISLCLLCLCMVVSTFLSLFFGWCTLCVFSWVSQWLTIWILLYFYFALLVKHFSSGLLSFMCQLIFYSVVRLHHGRKMELIKFSWLDVMLASSV